MKHNRTESQIQVSLLAPALAVAILGLSTSAQAQYSSPPRWSPMTMLNVSFDTTNLALSVVDEAVKLGAGVFPVLSVATHGAYDPAQPWSVLNGTAYSRRLGWNPGAGFSLSLVQSNYGAGAGVWIELLDKSPGLESYLAVGSYGTNSPSAYSGIFGTAGSSAKWQWDGQMDHNTYAVRLSGLSAANQLFSATYKVYVGDSAGNEILNGDGSSASTTEVWTWQGPAALIPSIATQPASQAVALGSNATFHVVADGVPAPAFQWRKNGAAIAGANAASYTLSSVQAADAGGYDVVLVNSSGSLTSQVAILSTYTALATVANGGGAGGGNWIHLQASHTPAPQPITNPYSNGSQYLGSFFKAYMDAESTAIPPYTPALTTNKSGFRFEPHSIWAMLNDKAYNAEYNWWKGGSEGYAPAGGVKVWAIKRIQQSAGLLTYAAVAAEFTNANYMKFGGQVLADGTVIESVAQGGQIFAQDGDTWLWSGFQMRNNVYAIDPAITNDLSAAYEISVWDVASRSVDTNYPATQITLNWRSGTPLTPVSTGYKLPPSWSPMTMLNTSFDTASLTLSVVDEADELGAGVYPVLSVAPYGAYDPTQPWGVLNGTAYSRRLGWNPAPGFSLSLIQSNYGGGAGVWIELLSKSPGLECYLAVGSRGTNSPNAYSGIFGTGGSSTKWQWDGAMDHNTYAVKLASLTAANQIFAATYRVYVGDSLGNEILNPDGSPGSSTEVWAWQGPATFAPTIATQPVSQAVALGSNATFQVTAYGLPAPAFQWRKNGAEISGAIAASYSIPGVQAADAGAYDVVLVNSSGSTTSTVATLTVGAGVTPPALAIWNTVVVEPPGASTEEVVEAAPALDATSWTIVTNAPVVIDGKRVILVDRTRSHQCFRLHSEGYCSNLVVNGDAEASPGVPDTSVTTMLAPAGWVVTGPITAAQYGGGGFPAETSPGPADRGANFFAGGRDSGMGGDSVSTAAQNISLAPFLGDIAGGRVGYSFSACLGGSSSDNDRAEVKLSFLDASSGVIASVTLPAVWAGDRTNVTGLLFRKTSGLVPAGARSVDLLLTITQANGMYNDGSADNIAFALLAPALPVQNKVAIHWQGASTNYVLLGAPTVDAPSWTPVTNTPVVIDGKTVILADPSVSQGYFRLGSPR